MTALLLCLAAAPLAYVLATAAVTYWVRFASVRRVMRGRDRRDIMLTFDDGPDPRHTGPLLDLLRAQQVRAVFFVVAEKARAHPELIARMAREGHVVALHSLSHQNPWTRPPREARRDVEEGVGLLRGLGVNPAYFRPSWGRVNLFSGMQARRHGLRPLFWTVMAQDWLEDATAQEIEQKLLRRVHGHSIICLHDSGNGLDCASKAPAHTIEALRAAIPILKNRGLRFTLPEVLG